MVKKVMDNQKMPITYLRNVTYAWRHHSGRYIKAATLSVEQCSSFYCALYGNAANG